MKTNDVKQTIVKMFDVPIRGLQGAHDLLVVSYMTRDEKKISDALNYSQQKIDELKALVPTVQEGK